MAENIEEIRRRKLEELGNRNETGESGETNAPTGTDASGETGPGTPSEPISIDGEGDLTATVSEHSVVLVDFYADWCGPCQMLEPVVDTIAAETDATVAKVDVDANQGLAAQHGVRGIPTLLLFADGQPVERLVGMQDEARLRSVIAEHA